MAENDGPEQPIVNVGGDLVALGPLRDDLLPLYHRWMNDLATVDRVGMPPGPMTVEVETAWYDGAATTTEYIPFTIYERAGWRAVGTCTLTQVDHRHGTAGLMIRLLLDVAFTALSLHNVVLSVDEANPSGHRA